MLKSKLAVKINTLYILQSGVMYLQSDDPFPSNSERLLRKRRELPQAETAMRIRSLPHSLTLSSRLSDLCLDWPDTRCKGPLSHTHTLNLVSSLEWVLGPKKDHTMEIKSHDVSVRDKHVFFFHENKSNQRATSKAVVLSVWGH